MKKLLYKNNLFLNITSFYGILVLYSSLYINSLIPTHIKLIIKLPIIAIYLLLLLIEFNNNKNKFFFILYWAYYIVILTIAIINKSSIVSIVYNDILIITTIISIVYFNTKYNYTNFIIMLIIIFTGYLFIGIFIYLIFGNESFIEFYTNRNWVYINNIILLIVLSISFSVLNNKKYWYLFIILSIIVLIQSIIIGAMTSNISIIIIIVTTVLLYYVNIKKSILVLKPLFAVIYNFIIFVVLMVDSFTNNFTTMISILFDKGNDFSGRKQIWYNGIVEISNNFFGFRNVVKEDIASKGFNYVFHNFHNFYLDALYDGGIIAFIVFFIFLIYISLNLTKNNNTKYQLLSSGLLFSVLLRFQMETYSQNCMFFSLSLIFFFIVYNKSILNNV